MNQLKSKEKEKIDVEGLIKDFKVLNIDNFNLYLREVFKVKLFLRSGFSKKK